MLRIGEAAERIGVSPSALRLWERQGLIRPARSPSGYRMYTDADLRHLRRIRRMRDEQVSAGGIRRLLRSVASGGPNRQSGNGALDGGRIRLMRRERGMSLRVAADRAGLSPSFLSALERNATGASVATLQRLTRAFGTTLIELFPRRSRPARRVRPRDRQALSLGTGVRIEQLARGATLLEPQLFVLGPNAASEGAYHHEGEEFLYVLDGHLTVWVDETERHRLSAGDALTFPSTLPHRWRNRADGETRVLWINTPPTF